MESDYDWFATADLSKYAGSWVAILNKKVIASGKDVKQVFDEIKKEKPHVKPLFVRVPEEKLFIV